MVTLSLDPRGHESPFATYNAIAHIHYLLTANQINRYINVYIHIIFNVNMIDLL